MKEDIAAERLRKVLEQPLLAVIKGMLHCALRDQVVTEFFFTKLRLIKSILQKKN